MPSGRGRKHASASTITGRLGKKATGQSSSDMSRPWTLSWMRVPVVRTDKRALSLKAERHRAWQRAPRTRKSRDLQPSSCQFLWLAFAVHTVVKIAAAPPSAINWMIIRVMACRWPPTTDSNEGANSIDHSNGRDQIRLHRSADEVGGTCRPIRL